MDAVQPAFCSAFASSGALVVAWVIIILATTGVLEFAFFRAQGYRIGRLALRSVMTGVVIIPTLLFVAC
jgi:hypothetical protein